MAYTYMVLCADGTFYTGWTTNLEKRIQAHNEGRGARYTRCRKPVNLAYWEEQPDRSEAQRREYYLRHLPKSEKENLARSFTGKKDTGGHYDG